MPPTGELDVFLSSAQEEFKNSRKILSKKISKMPFLKCIPLEERGADCVSVEEASLKAARTCDIYIGIFGNEYSELTIKEYREAVKHRKLCLNYVKKLSNRNSRLQKFIDEELEPHFKYHKFGTRKDLYAQVEANLYEQLNRLLRMGLDDLRNSKKQAFATQTELKPAVTKAIKQKEEDKPILMLNDATSSFSKADFMGATMKAAIAVELASRLALLRTQIPSRELKRASLGRILRLLESHEILEIRDIKQLQELVYLRNATIHEGKTPTEKTTAWILKLAREIVDKLLYVPLEHRRL
jgi:hypothetical protein